MYTKTPRPAANTCAVRLQSSQYSASSSPNGLPHFMQLGSAVSDSCRRHSGWIRPFCNKPSHTGHRLGYKRSSTVSITLLTIFLSPIFPSPRFLSPIVFLPPLSPTLFTASHRHSLQFRTGALRLRSRAHSRKDILKFRIKTAVTRLLPVIFDHPVKHVLATNDDDPFLGSGDRCIKKVAV